MKKFIAFPAFLCLVALISLSFKTIEKSQAKKLGGSCTTTIIVVNQAGGDLNGVRLRDAQNPNNLSYGNALNPPYQQLWVFHIDPNVEYTVEVLYDNANGNYNSAYWSDLLGDPSYCEQHSSTSGNNWGIVQDMKRYFKCNEIMADLTLFPNYDCTQ